MTSADVGSDVTTLSHDASDVSVEGASLEAEDLIQCAGLGGAASKSDGEPA